MSLACTQNQQSIKTSVLKKKVCQVKEIKSTSNPSQPKHVDQDQFPYMGTRLLQTLAPFRLPLENREQQSEGKEERAVFASIYVCIYLLFELAPELLLCSILFTPCWIKVHCPQLNRSWSHTCSTVFIAVLLVIAGTWIKPSWPSTKKNG